jgi:hypothetical protein
MIKTVRVYLKTRIVSKAASYVAGVKRTVINKFERNRSWLDELKSKWSFKGVE